MSPQFKFTIHPPQDHYEKDIDYSLGGQVIDKENRPLTQERFSAVGKDGHTNKWGMATHWHLVQNLPAELRGKIERTCRLESAPNLQIPEEIIAEARNRIEETVLFSEVGGVFVETEWEDVPRTEAVTES